MSIMKKLLLGLTLSIFAAGSQAIEITLQDLFDGGQIQAGDKLFSDWIWWSEGDALLSEVDPSAIFVSTIDDALNPGLIFDVTGGLSGVNPNLDYLNLDFGYRVDVLDPTMRVKSTSSDILLADGSGLGTIDITSFIQDENFFDLGLTNIFTGNPGGTQLSDSASFDNQNLVYVDTYVELVSQGGAYVLGSFEQRFMQVPVPATLLLLGMGLLGLGFTRRKS